MPYVRKTEDIYVLQTDYGYGDGWEDLTAEKTRAEIRKRKAEYMENDPRTYRIVKRRQRIEPTPAA